MSPGKSHGRMPACFAATVAVATAMLGLLSFSGCRDEVLTPLKPEVREPLLAAPEARTVRLDVNYCSLPPQRKSYKTRFVVIFDRSGSNQDCPAEICGALVPGTDPDASRRFDGMLRFMSQLTPEQQQLFSFALIYFSSDPATYGAETDPGVPTAEMDRGLKRFGHSFMSAREFVSILAEPESSDSKGEKNPHNKVPSVPQDAGWTDYLLALKTAHQLVNQDIQTQNEQYSYVFILVSDGAPIVNGRLGPPPSNPFEPPPQTYREAWSDPSARNDIKRQLSELMSLSEHEIVLGLSFNTVFYSAPDVPQDIGTGCKPRDTSCTPCIAGDPSCSPAGLLKHMAREGGGQFLDYSAGGEIDFSRITLPSMLVHFKPVEVYAHNRNVRWNDGLPVRDSDGDGLPDALENPLGYDPEQTSTRRNGVSDFVERKICADRVSCKLEELIATHCELSFGDTDGDGLNDCEEALLGSDALAFDSNGDLLPDGLAALQGIFFKPGSPACASQDGDFDGWDDCREIKFNTPPAVPNRLISGLKPYQYITKRAATSSASASCFQIVVDDVTVLANTDTIEFLAVEQPDFLQAAPVLRRAEKRVSGDRLIFQPEDFR